MSDLDYGVVFFYRYRLCPLVACNSLSRNSGIARASVQNRTRSFTLAMVPYTYWCARFGAQQITRDIRLSLTHTNYFNNYCYKQYKYLCPNCESSITYNFYTSLKIWFSDQQLEVYFHEHEGPSV